jgi:hypothetical protein
MASRVRAAVLALALSATALPSEVQAWGSAGHSVVAEIAQRRLKPAAARRIKALLGTEASLASIASWADTLAIAKPQTRRWHFVNIPVGATGYDAGRDCQATAEGDCILAAIERARQTLANTRAPRAQRAEALKLLVHFMGDLHQPLHCADRNRDNGGNLLVVTFFGAPSTLHQVWDFGILDKASYDWGEHVRAASEWLAGQDTAVLSRGRPLDWVWESHVVAVESAYGPVSGVSDAALGDDYQRRSLPIVRRQLALAGVRLARLLNEALGRPEVRRPRLR